MKIIAVGGGDIGKPGKKAQTTSIDKEIIKQTGKKRPRLLFIPTASGDSEGYCRLVQRHFGKGLGCRTDALLLIREKPTKKEIEKKILSSDIVYVGGGNTLRMLKIWRKKGVDRILRKAKDNGIVLSGLSAGAICWFKHGNSDSLKYSDRRNPLIKLKGLNLCKLMVCPHYDSEKERRPSLRMMIGKYGGTALALENNTAIEIIDDKYRIITSSKKANAFKLYRKNRKVVEERLNSDGDFRFLKELITS
jgi:dipeptidase E